MKGSNEQNDMVNRPKHYTLIPERNVQVLDVIFAALEKNNLEGWDGYAIGNALKYLLRCGRKGKYIEDLKKARFYINCVIEEGDVR